MNQTEQYKQQILEAMNNAPHDPDHCRHGVYIGNWSGPDYMCHLCEAGVTDELIAQAKAELITQRIEESVQAARTLHDNGLINGAQFGRLLIAAFKKYEPR